MKAAHLKGYQNFEIVEVDIPAITTEQVLENVDKFGICRSVIGMWNYHDFSNVLYDWKGFIPGQPFH